MKAASLVIILLTLAKAVASDSVMMLGPVKEARTVTLAKDTELTQLTFAPGTISAQTLQGHTLSLSNSARVTFEKLPADVGMGKKASQTISSALRLSGDVHFANMNRAYLGGEKLILAGQISGSGNFITDGVHHGIVQLTAGNPNYTGAFHVETGSLMVSHSGALGSGKDPVTLNGGAVVIGARISTSHDFLITKNADWDAHGPNGNHDGTITIQEGATFHVKNGGGNTMTWLGAITGSGNLSFDAHGTTLAGDQSNTLTGTVTVGGIRGATILARKKGVNVIPGPLVMSGKGTLRWSQDDQVADGVPVTFAGDAPAFELQGHSERMGTLNLQSDATIYPGGGDLSFANSSHIPWNPDSVLIIKNGIVRFGENENGLTQEQLKQIGFVKPTGTYTAQISSDGDVCPTTTLVTPIDLPVDQSPEASSRRRALFDVQGIAKLTSEGTSLKKKGTVISFYGDSITWNGGYLRVLENAINAGMKTKDLAVRIINHGVNGGGILSIRDGDEGTAHSGNTKPLPFAQTIAADKPDIAIIFIGVNDVSWRKTEESVYEKAMRDLVDQAKAKGVIPVLATLAIMKEKVGELNPDCTTFANITRKVARETGVTLVDLRAAFIACMESQSIEVAPGGTWESNGNLLTHDGVHTNAKGDKLIADQIALGVFSALAK